MRHAFRVFTVVSVTVIASFAVAACGSSSSSSTKSAKEVAAAKVKVGLVTDTGGLNDHSFNQLANTGLKQAHSKLGVTTNVLESKSSSDYESNLGKFAQQGYALSIGVGYLMGDSIKSVAARAPDQHFAIIDFAYDPTPKNVRGLVFKEQEAGYLAGALAGMVESDGSLKGLNSQKIVSSVGGQKIPPVDKYIAGYEAGVKAFCKDCKTMHQYANDFTAQDKCKEAALSQIGQGSDIVFQVAGGCGLGALDAAREKGVWGIGVDADQAYLGSHILTSAMKRVDFAVYDTIRAETKGTFMSGIGVYGLKEGGVGLGKIAAPAKQYQPMIDQVIADITSGKVVPPTDVS